jgi:hypothetical protein
MISLLLLIAFGSLAFAQYRKVNIHEIQQVPVDSLKILDVSQASGNWLLQTSPLYKPSAQIASRETVTVVGQVVVPPKVINFTASGWDLLLGDTSQTAIAFSGVFLRANIADSSSLINQGFLNLERGDIIEINCWVDEYPVSSVNSSTQLVPIAGTTIKLLSNRVLPKPVRVNVADFYSGQFPGGTIKFSTGDQYEGVYVEFVNLKAVTVLNGTNGTFNVLDASGQNMISTLDVSKWFTTRGHRDPASTYALPSFPSRIDTIRGYLSTNSGSEEPRGYRICPIFPGDIVYGTGLPVLWSHRRDSVVVTITPPSDTGRVSVKADALPGNAALKKVELFYRLNLGAWQRDSVMPPQKDTTYRFKIPPQSVNTEVHYFFKATDTLGSSTIMASSAIGPAGSDTSKGFFMYKVLNRPLTIQDIQYTPFVNGRTPYLGAVVSLTGVVTADTSDLSTLSELGRWYMQAGNQPWSGIWLTGVDSILSTLRKGDSVTVTGSVQEQYDVTRLANISKAPTIHARGKALPDPVAVKTSDFANRGNGEPIAEQWEGMLVKFTNVQITDVNPTWNIWMEFQFDDGSGPLLGRMDGMSKWSNNPADSLFGKTIFYRYNKFSYLQGIVFYSFNRYKVCPRGNSDFGNLTEVQRIEGIAPGSFALAQNYPNPFNPTTTIDFTIPTTQHVRLAIYNMLGQEVRVLANEVRHPGAYRVRFDASGMPSGIYFYRLIAGSNIMTKRMALLK